MTSATPETEAAECRELLYVYAVLPAGERPCGPSAPALPPGVGGRPVRFVRGAGPAAGLAAAVGEVPAEDFGEDALERRLEDLAWLEDTARSHHAVVEALGAAGPVLPLRLATVYRSEPRVRAVLAERAAEFASRLDRLTGHLEWGVKVYLRRGGARPSSPEPSGGGAAAAAGSGTSGRDYLRRRRAQRRSEEDGWQAAARVGERIDAAVGPLVTAARRLRPQDPRLPGASAGAGVNVVNTAYLVAEDRSEEFRALVAREAAREPEVYAEVIGPWAPYSFAADADVAADPGHDDADGSVGDDSGADGGGSAGGPREAAV